MEVRVPASMHYLAILTERLISLFAIYVFLPYDTDHLRTVSLEPINGLLNNKTLLNCKSQIS